jgi:hypothetical protein
MLDALPRMELRADGVHFTPAGYAILAERILPQLRTAVETRVGMVARRKQRNEWRCLVIPMILAFR